jgi:flagellar motor switch protein FliM
MDFEENALGPQAVPQAAEYQTYTPGALPSAQLAFVRAMQEKFLQAFAEALAVRLETPVAAQIVSVQPLSGSEFLKSADLLGCLLTLDAEPVRGQAFIALSAGLVAYLLRALLGAPPTPDDGSHAVTEIESHILREIFESLARELTEAWKLSGIAFRWTPAAGEAPDGQCAMVVFDCQLVLDDAPQTLRIAAPAFLARLAALQSTLAVEEDAPAPVRETILAALRRASVGVEAVLAGSTLRMKDLLAMERGQVLMLAQPTGSPLECRINGKTKFRGEWIAHGDLDGLELL